MFKPMSVPDRKGNQNRGKPDSPAYRYPDSGCPFATEFLSQMADEPVQSLCFECPFTKCMMDANRA